MISIVFPIFSYVFFPFNYHPHFLLILPASPAIPWPGRKRGTAEAAAVERGISSALRGFGDISRPWADDHLLHPHAGLVVPARTSAGHPPIESSQKKTTNYLIQHRKNLQNGPSNPSPSSHGSHGNHGAKWPPRERRSPPRSSACLLGGNTVGMDRK